jgi:hypothetical protein
MSQMTLSNHPPVPSGLELQLKDQRRTVDFDTFDIFTQQLIGMIKTNQIWISPTYQRKFRWRPEQSSQFIESLLLGIPVPSLFMATNGDNTWEVVDGVQRLTTLAWFAGDSELRRKLTSQINAPLILTGMNKLYLFNDLLLEDLPTGIKQHFWTRPIKVITLNDKSDKIVRYDLFERLNTGGVALSPQEIRDCIFQGQFADKLEKWAKERNFAAVVKLTPLQQRDATAEECVLRFFAFMHRYSHFDHAVTEFLNNYMEQASKQFDYVDGDAIFQKTFQELARVFPGGIRRPGGKNRTPLNLFEGIAVGAAMALRKTARLRTGGLDKWLASPELRSFTTGATNDRAAVKGRIEFCRDRFLGKPYVPNAST